MTLTDLFLAQIGDPLRLGLAMMMFYTATRTAHTLGYLAPLALGIVFVAVLIPLSAGLKDGATMRQIGVGLLSTSVILGVLFAVRAIVAALRRKAGG